MLDENDFQNPEIKNFVNNVFNNNSLFSSQLLPPYNKEILSQEQIILFKTKFSLDLTNTCLKLIRCSNIISK